MTILDTDLSSLDEIANTLTSSKIELSNYRKIMEIFQQFESDLKDIDNTLNEQVTVSTLVKKPYQSLINLINRNSVRLKQKSTVEAKIDMLDDNIRILASLLLKERSHNHSN